MHLSFFNDSNLVADLILGKLFTDVSVEFRVQSLVDSAVLSLWAIL